MNWLNLRSIRRFIFHFLKTQSYLIQTPLKTMLESLVGLLLLTRRITGMTGETKTVTSLTSLFVEIPSTSPNRISLAMLCTFTALGREAALTSLKRYVVEESTLKRIHFRTLHLSFTLLMEVQFPLNVTLSRLRTQRKLDLHSKLHRCLSKRFCFQTYFKIVKECIKCTGRTSMQQLCFRTHFSIALLVKREVPSMQDKSQTLWFKKMFLIQIAPLCKCIQMQKICLTKDSL